MNPLRPLLDKQFAEALGCATDDEYRRTKEALLSYLRRIEPEQFKLEGGRKRAFERMAEMEGNTVEEKLEDMVLTGYLLRRSFAATTKEQAFDALASCDVPEKDRPLLEKLMGELYSRLRRG
jgi:hypothetical protein